ncbi:MAG TPA: phosphopantetheine-binding protein, partial [Longimicrobiaceae bacterium]|nr:phosphopantetheine-binding protein [Longimicrobiaceae bacterium]
APGDARLVGYVVPRAGAALSAAELRRALAAELPAHVAPSAVVVLDALPLGPGGKTDRAALPAPAVVGAEHRLPRTPAEVRVAAVWREVLGVERVGVDDHFFDLGGHSLLATQVVSRLRARLGVDVVLQEFLDAPTLAALAAAVDRAEAARLDALLAGVEALSDEEAGALYDLESTLHADAAAARPDTRP